MLPVAIAITSIKAHIAMRMITMWASKWAEEKGREALVLFMWETLCEVRVCLSGYHEIGILLGAITGLAIPIPNATKCLMMREYRWNETNASWKGVHKRRRLCTVVNTFQTASCTISPLLPAVIGSESSKSSVLG
jgi:hypothetical protein